MANDEMLLHPSPTCTAGRADWIPWGAKLADCELKPAVAGTPDVGPVVIEYDEVAGVAKNQQDHGAKHSPLGAT